MQLFQQTLHTSPIYSGFCLIIAQGLPTFKVGPEKFPTCELSSTMLPMIQNEYLQENFEILLQVLVLPYRDTTCIT